jgi:hypothetical protein
MLFKFQKIVGCIEPWVKNRDTNRIVSLCIVTALLHIDGNPFQWWKLHQHKFPCVSKHAKRYLCVPGTSVASERVFSTAGDIVSATRSCLSPENVDMLIFLQKNMKTE